MPTEIATSPQSKPRSPAAPEAAPRKTPAAIEADARIEEVWTSYKQSPSRPMRNVLMEHYLPLVQRCAERVHKKLPATVQLDDLVSAGVLGLMDAIEAFSPDRKVRFSTFSATRIRGAILDELRSLDWVPRLVRTNAKKLDAASRQLEAELGRSPSEQEVAGRLSLSDSQYRDLSDGGRAVMITSLTRRENDDDEGRGEPTPMADARSADPVHESQRRTLKAAITRGLSRAERLLITLYYYEDLTMREVGQVLDLSESRVSQMHTQILRRLKSTIASPDGPSMEEMAA